LDSETLNEGLAYAVAPGLVHAGPAEDDPLGRTVGSQIADGNQMSDPLTRFNRYGLALRPLLKDALADDRQSLSTFLPRAIDVWRALHEVATATEARGREEELKMVTITALYRATSTELPAFVREGNARQPNPTEYFMACKEWVAGTYRQMSVFFERVGHEVRFTAQGHPEIRGRLNGHTVSSGDGSFQAYGVEILAEDREKILPGVAYDLKPINTNESFRWQISDHFIPILLRD
jgi:hypothetical protein